jgi:AcrR family transcriptional regulator
MASAPTALPVLDRPAVILEAACRVIVREGAHGLRMARVAEEAGVSKALVHYYFSTRQELLRNAFAFSEARWLAAVNADLAESASGAAMVERVLLVSVETKLPFSEQRALWNEVWSSLRADDELRPVVERSYRAWLDRVVSLIEQGQGDGSIPADVEASTAGLRLAAVADGLDSLLYLGLIDRQQARDLIRSSIVRELGT